MRPEAKSDCAGEGQQQFNQPTTYRNLSGEGRSVDSETVEDWKNYRLLQETEG
jgi:hypothetical protein